MRDDELVERIRRSDPEAAEAFERRFRSLFERLTIKYGVPRAEREDLAQEALAKSFVAIRNGGFAGRSTLLTWIFRIGINVILDWQRHRAKAGRVDEDGGREMAARTTDPTFRLRIQRALTRLSARHRVVLLLSLEGRTIQEIAPLLKLSAGRTGAILAEAKRAFRIALRTEGFSNE